MTTLTTLAFAATNFISDENLSAAKICSARTRYGTYNGFMKGGVRTWLGIAYAKPPVGNLRWRAPEKLEPSTAEFDAKKLGASPIQDRDELEPTSLLPQSEDCLTLNIWAHNSTTRKPVMVFIPGGGFVNGGNGDPAYNGANLAKAHDVVVVTINYRLNIFGFMNFAEIDPAFEDSGYLGLKDQAIALAWVKENIEHFGGDPDNITVFGESAGSISTMLLMTAPAVNGLFTKAIAQSGHAAFYQEPDDSAKLARLFMDVNGYSDMRELMTMPATELEAAYEKLAYTRAWETEFDYMPTADGKFLPKSPMYELSYGAGKGVKLLTGTTAEEYRYWLLYFKDFLKIVPKVHPTLNPLFYADEFTEGKELYAAWQKNHMDLPADERYLEFADQLDWRVGQELCAEYHSAFDTTYYYLFSQTSPVEGLGSCHAIDLPFVFGNPAHDIEAKPSAKLIKQVQATWTAFAATGDPKNELIPQWHRYTADDRRTMEINSKAWVCRKDLNTANLNELRVAYENHLPQ
ncbi:MAG: carboxylesterase/lipase family protein [Quinella sp. 2Q5]|nr:carboxylesterase/lipase family protein [Quinella sp. 2Q5]